MLLWWRGMNKAAPVVRRLAPPLIRTLHLVPPLPAVVTPVGGVEDGHSSSRWFSSKSLKGKQPSSSSKPIKTSIRRRSRVEVEDEVVVNNEVVLTEDIWEEEDEGKEPKIGDGGGGGGIVLGNVIWGQKVLSLANEVLQMHFGGSCGDFRIFAFRVTPKGYVYVRLEKLSDKYGCPDIKEVARFNRLYSESLEESGKLGEIPDNLAVSVSSPGLDRLLRVPEDLDRFKELPLYIKYLEEEDAESIVPSERKGVFYLVSIDNEAMNCVWKLADVKENRDPGSRGRKLSKEKLEWRLILPFQMVKSAVFYHQFLI